MSNKWGIKPEQAEVLTELEKIISKSIPKLAVIKAITFGAKIEDDNLVELGLYDSELKSLPESIGNLHSLEKLYLGRNLLTKIPDSIIRLKSLQTLDLHDNKLTTLPESITSLESLEILSLWLNQLEILPESIGNLKSLQILNLSSNFLSSLPESITYLESLQLLYLDKNNLTSLPKSMWRLKNLETLDLNGNNWDEEWKVIVKRDAPAIIEFSRQRMTINVFISHVVSEFTMYRIEEIAKYLEHQPEINEVFFCEEDLRGNIDAWMEETIKKSQLILFIGTQQSIYHSRDCSNELYLARDNNIEVTPIKGLDASWEDLKKVGLSREIGFEFNEVKFQELCEELYKYIYKFKRKRDLLIKEHDKITETKSRIQSLFKDYVTSKLLKKISLEHLRVIEKLEYDLKTNKILFSDFLRKLEEFLL